MINFFKKFELPHIATFKWQWLRRAMVIITVPQEIIRAVYGVFCGAKLWWNWDGTTDPNNFWEHNGTRFPAPVFKQ